MIQIESVCETGRQVRRVRGDALGKLKGGLRGVYRTLELPGENPLKDAHAALDSAVLAAYGFAAKKDLLAQLLELNFAVAPASRPEKKSRPPASRPIIPIRTRGSARIAFVPKRPTWWSGRTPSGERFPAWWKACTVRSND